MITTFNRQQTLESVFEVLFTRKTISKCQLSVLVRCLSYKEFSYREMTEKLQGPTQGVHLEGVHLIEVSILRVDCSPNFFSGCFPCIFSRKLIYNITRKSSKQSLETQVNNQRTWPKIGLHIIGYFGFFINT